MKGRTAGAGADRGEGRRRNPARGRAGARRDFGQQAIVRREEQLAAAGHRQQAARGAHSGIDHGEVDADGQVGDRDARQPEAGLGGAERLDVVRHVDDRRVRRAAQDHALHHGDEGIALAEIGGQGDDAAHGTGPRRWPGINSGLRVACRQAFAVLVVAGLDLVGIAIGIGHAFVRLRVALLDALLVRERPRRAGLAHAGLRADIVGKRRGRRDQARERQGQPPVVADFHRETHLSGHAYLYGTARRSANDRHQRDPAALNER